MTDSIELTGSTGRQSLWSRFVLSRLTLAHQVGWVTGPYFVQQVLRLLSNVVLAWLLAPALLGTMLLINTLRTAGELLTDVGVGQSIVNNRRGADPVFYNTAWTIQILRGFMLFGLALLLTRPIADAFGHPELCTLLPAVAPIFLLTGFTAPARYLLQKRMAVRRIALFDLTVMILGTLIQILLAWITPTIWALVWGLLIATSLSAFGSYFLLDWRTLRLRLDRAAARDVLHFGKWIFVASLIYFLAMNFDRLYFADAIPLALLGVYGIARTFADTVMQLFQRMGNLLVFPRISGSISRGGDLRRVIGPLRLVALATVAAGLALGVSLADQFIYIFYDQRYYAAGFFLPVLLVGTWFGILATMADAMMMGIGKPSGVAFSNGAKLGVIVLALPLVLPRFGINAALGVFLMAEAVRYTMLAWRGSAAGLGFARQDIVMTMLFFILIVLFREGTMLLGLTDGIGGWIAEARVSHG